MKKLLIIGCLLSGTLVFAAGKAETKDKREVAEAAAASKYSCASFRNKIGAEDAAADCGGEVATTTSGKFFSVCRKSTRSSSDYYYDGGSGGGGGGGGGGTGGGGGDGR